MSSDINGIGGRPYQLRDSQSFSPRPNVGPTANSGAQTQDTSASDARPVEGFAPTAAMGESPQERQAGEAQADQIFSAWDSSQAPTVSAGRWDIQGAENTTVHQVHGSSGGQYVGGAAPESGFSGGTVYSSRRPT